jgi:hypothetical protein
MRGPGESLRRPRLPEFGETYPGAIYLGPRIIAIHSPAIPWTADPQIIVEYDEVRYYIIAFGYEFHP